MIIYKIVTEILGSLKHYVDDLIILGNHPTKVEMMEARKLVEINSTDVTCYEPDLHLFGWMVIIVKEVDWMHSEEVFVLHQKILTVEDKSSKQVDITLMA